MQLREMVRANLVRVRSIINKERIHAHLLMYNIKIDGTHFTKEYIKTLRKLIQDKRLPKYYGIVQQGNK